MTIRAANVLNATLVIVGFVVSALLYTRLPESVPTHWNLRGDPDGFTPKPWGPFVLPLVMAAMAVIFSAAPRVSPAGFRMESFAPAFRFVKSCALVFLLLIHVVALLAGIGVSVPMNRVAEGGLGVLVIVVGNYMGKLSKNFFLGIRTPWTLSNDEVWRRTHRLGGKLFVAAGLVLLGSAVLNTGLVWPLCIAGMALVVPVVYSFIVFRRIQHQEPDAKS